MSWLTGVVGVLGSLFGGAGGGNNVLSEAVSVVGQHVEDVNKKNDLIVELVKTYTQQKMQPTIPIVDALLKVLEFLAWYAVVGLWIWSQHIGKPFDLTEVAMALSGPGVVTLVRRSFIK